MVTSKKSSKSKKSTRRKISITKSQRAHFKHLMFGVGQSEE